MAQTIKIQDERIEAVRVRYGLDTQDFWQLPQNKQWCIKHSALEVVAAKEKITFDAPMIIEARAEDGIATICVTGHMGERSIWSIGEASPKNSKNSYPWAMAEKRAIDRVVLKLAGIHGLLYSDTEVVTEAQEAPPRAETGSVVSGATDHLEAALGPSTGPLKSSAQAKRDGDWELLKQEIDACQTLPELNLLVASKAFIEAVAPIPKAWKEHLRDYVVQARKEFEDKPAPAATPKSPDYDAIVNGETP